MKRIILLLILLIGAAACGPRRQPAGNTAAERSCPAAEAQQPLCGGYSAPHAPTGEETALFRQVTASLKGVDYTPESVATQIVAGTNYKFTCTARTRTASPRTFRAEIVVFEPLSCRHEEPSVTRITKVTE